MAKKIFRHVRTPFGKFVKFLFAAFNILMLIWLVTYWSDISGMLDQGDEYSQAGAAIGSALGTGLILAIWALGDVVLGIAVLLTRGDMVEYTPEELEAEKHQKREKEKWTRPYIYGGLALIVILVIIGNISG